MKKNKKIHNKKIVVLLGAGSALPWGGITTAQIKETFVNDTTYGIKKMTFGKYLFDVLDSYYKGNPSGANFETFIAALEAIMNYIITDTNSIGINYTPAIFNLKNRIEILFAGKTIDEKRQCVCELFQHYINLVITEIEKYNSTILEQRGLNIALRRFTRFFLDKGYSVKFYTTNYDSLIPQALLPFIDVYEGLLFKKGSKSKDFDYNLNHFRKAPVSHFNLHGSIYHLRQYSGETLKYETVYGNKVVGIAEANIEDAGNPSEPLLFSPIITGFNKTQRMVMKPFNLGFSALTADLNNCDGLLTVGYSFLDPHINSILSSFTSWDKAKFVNVNLFRPPHANFDDQRSREDHELDYSVTRMIKKEENVTWFHDISGKKHIYKRGFEKFLKNNFNWRYLLP